MGRELGKFVCIVSFVICWQFGCGLRESKVAPLTSSTGLGPGEAYGRRVTPKNSTDVLSNCDQTQGLPCDEVQALQTVLNKLGLMGVTVNRSFCEDVETINTELIKFSCSTPENEPHHITMIQVMNSNSSGYLHEDVSKLQYLDTLIILNSQLSGSIPDLGKLSSLKQLGLAKNQLTGPIPPTLGYLKNLEYFSLSDNKLNGPIPRELGDLSNLTYLDLSINQLTGEIPDNFTNFKKLADLYLNENLLGGIISHLGKVQSLTSLDLRYNKFQGQIPSELRKLKSLEVLLLDENLFSGNIPEELGKLSKLEYLSLTSNNLTDILPSSFSNLKLLKRFEVGGNNLTGKIPSYIKDWDNLFFLNLLGNNFEGPLPPEILNMFNLTTLWVSDLKNNSFKFPDNANLSNIYSLIMRNCLIKGEIPSYIGDWTFIDYLDLSFNQLEGPIPDSLNHTFLTELYLTGNKLSGQIPKWINNLHKMDLSFNKFTDVAHSKAQKGKDAAVPIINEDTIMNWNLPQCKNGTNTSLAINSGGERVLNEGTYYEADESLSKNYMSRDRNWAYTCSGDFISGAYNNSVYINNMTCGAANVSNEPLHERSRLCPVNLTYYGFCLKKGSYKVKLYFAETIYVNDFDYSSLGKRVFDVYVQDKKVVQDLNIKEMAKGSNKEYVYTIKKAKVGPDNLLRISLFWAGKGSIYNAPHLNGPLISAISVSPKFFTRLTTLQRVVITVACILALVLLLVLLWRMELIGDRALRKTEIKIERKTYTLKQIIDATGKFSDKMKIGTGHYGILYKAELPNGTNQTVVVVKKVHHELVKQRGSNPFFNLGRLEHENLVRFHGGHSKGDLHLLIYEYMEGGSLEAALFESKLDLNWKARLKICKDIAKGLTFLHEDSGLGIIHGDLKASNVLLDGSSPPKAKLSDYGLADFLEEGNQNFYYRAPEYHYQLVTPVTVKADVFSFGFLLLELLSGKHATEFNEKGDLETLLFEADKLNREKKVEQFVYIKELSSTEKKEASTLVGLALKCASQFPDQRPKMSEVLDVLEGRKKLDEISTTSTPSRGG